MYAELVTLLSSVPFENIETQYVVCTYFLVQDVWCTFFYERLHH